MPGGGPGIQALVHEEARWGSLAASGCPAWDCLPTPPVPGCLLKPGGLPGGADILGEF